MQNDMCDLRFGAPSNNASAPIPGESLKTNSVRACYTPELHHLPSLSPRLIFVSRLGVWRGLSQGANSLPAQGHGLDTGDFLRPRRCMSDREGQ